MDSPIDYLANAEPAYWSLVHSLKNILKIPKDAHILEIGTGLGYMTYSLRKDGYMNAYGLDISQKAIEEACKQFGDYYICADARIYAKNCAVKYGFIYLMEVIEHMENPVELIKNILPLLNKGGYIMMTTPDKSVCPDSVIWATDKPPIHYWWFSDLSFKKMAGQLDLKVSFLNWTEYYKNHKRGLVNTKIDEILADNYFFDRNNQLIESENIGKKLKSSLIFPDWIKRTYLYRSITPFVYPLISKSITRIDRTKSTTLCVLLQPN